MLEQASVASPISTGNGNSKRKKANLKCTHLERVKPVVLGEIARCQAGVHLQQIFAVVDSRHSGGSTHARIREVVRFLSLEACAREPVHSCRGWLVNAGMAFYGITNDSIVRLKRNTRWWRKGTRWWRKGTRQTSSERALGGQTESVPGLPPWITW